VSCHLRTARAGGGRRRHRRREHRRRLRFRCAVAACRRAQLDLKRGEVAGTWLDSHYRWQIRTFWFTLLWLLVYGLLIITIIGIPFAWLLIVVLGIWVAYRVIRGWLALAVAAVGIIAATLNIEVVREVIALEPIGWMVGMIGRLVPYLVAIGTFTLIYMAVPNTRVDLCPALAGGFVGGMLWQLSGWGFAVFIASSSKYSAIYSSFAVVILFMFWLYLSWLILLFGASVSFYWQHPESVVASGGEPRLSNRMRERLALAIMSSIGAHYLSGRPAWTLPKLCQALQVPRHAVEAMLRALQNGGLLVQSQDVQPGYLPARDLGAISVKQLLDIVRSAGESGFLNPASLPVPERVEQVLQQIDSSLGTALETMSVMDLCR
jgi:membrane protein